MSHLDPRISPFRATHPHVDFWIRSPRTKIDASIDLVDPKDAGIDASGRLRGALIIAGLDGFRLGDDPVLAAEEHGAACGS